MRYRVVGEMFVVAAIRTPLATAGCNPVAAPGKKLGNHTSSRALCYLHPGPQLACVCPCPQVASLSTGARGRAGDGGL